jgi:acetolactate synthase-1/2/3 large subunit
MEETLEPYATDPAHYTPVAPGALTGEVTREIATALAGASHPLIITSYLGRNPDAVGALVELAELLAEADVILVVDSDVPWIQATSRPAPDAAVYAIDIDPLKPGMSMWHLPARRFAAAGPGTDRRGRGRGQAGAGDRG